MLLVNSLLSIIFDDGHMPYFSKLIDVFPGLWYNRSLWAIHHIVHPAATNQENVMPKTTSKKAVPRKPRPDFPLFPHARGYWCKKVRGKLRYFGRIAEDPKGENALNLWLEQKDDLLAGRTPRSRAGALTLRELLDRFMVSRRDRLNAKEISPQYFIELYRTCERIGECFGLNRIVVDLGPDDFAALRNRAAKRWGPVRLNNEVQWVRSVFKFALESGLIEKPILFGPDFKPVTRKVLRQSRARNGLRMFEAADLRSLLDAANQPMRAMIWLAINCGFGNSDIANLPIKALDLATGWVTFPRPKTGILRRCPLWPETIAAIRKALAKRHRPKSKADAGLVFITQFGRKWEKFIVTEPESENGERKLHVSKNSPVAIAFGRLLAELGLKRRGLGFYAIRHTFETVAGNSRDQVAVNALMGHVDESMAAVYRERIDDDRLRAVVNHVHGWLFAGGKKGDGT